MKKRILNLVIAAAVVAPSMASASGPWAPDIPAPVMSTMATTFLPIMATGATSDKSKNDVMMVKEDAVLALETGKISDELQSVINQWRADHKDAQGNDPYFDASDYDVIEIMLIQADQR